MKKIWKKKNLFFQLLKNKKTTTTKKVINFLAKIVIHFSFSFFFLVSSFNRYRHGNLYFVGIVIWSTYKNYFLKVNSFNFRA